MCCRISHCPVSNSQFTDIIIAHDGRADSLKAIAPKPIVVHESYFYMVFNHYIFMSIIAIFMSLFSSDQQKK